MKPPSTQPTGKFSVVVASPVAVVELMTSTWVHVIAADATSTSSNMMVALAVPDAVMTPPCHVVTGPSETGGAQVPEVDDA
jgi:hypothetical protein